MLELHPPLAVGQVHGGPIVVLEGAPDQEVVVDHDRVGDAQLARRSSHVFEVVLEPELRGVRADDDETAVAVTLVPRPQVGEGPQPVDAGVRPEVDEHDVPPQPLGGERIRVEPYAGAIQRRERTGDVTRAGHAFTLTACSTPRAREDPGPLPGRPVADRWGGLR